MPEGLVRTDLNKTGTTFNNGIPVTEPLNFGTPITLPHNFGIALPVSDPTFDSNPVTWTVSPAHFGNNFAPAGDFLVQENGTSLFVLETGTGDILLET